MNDQLTKQLTAVIMAHGLAMAAHGQAPAPSPAAGTNAPSKLPDVVVKGAQEQPAPEYKPENLQSPRYTEPLRDVPQTITVVPRAVMEQQNATTLRDVLRNVPGISFQAGEGGVPAGDNLALRGFSARTDMFVDGVRDFGGYSRDSFNLEQVEVVKGPASAYAGRGSTGGSINLVSKSPQLDPFYAGSFGFGTEDYKRLTLDLNQPIADSPVEGTSLRLNGMWTESGIAGRDVVQDERWGIAPSITFGLGTPTRATLSYFHLEQDNLPGYGIPWVPANTNGFLARYSNKAAPVDFSNFYGLKSDFEKVRTDIPTALLEHDFSEQLTLRNLTRFGRTDRDSVYTSPRFRSVNTSTEINRQFQSRDQADTIFANHTDLTTKFETWDFDHTLVSSVEYSHESSENHTRAIFTNGVPILGGGAATAPYADLFNPDPNVSRLGPIGRTGENQFKADSVAVSFFDTIKFNEQWQLQGGVRWDHFDAEYVALTNNAARMKPLERTDDEITWRAGLVYKPVEIGSIYAAYGTSFNPSGEGLTFSSAPAAANNFSVDPETSRSFELGTKWDLLDNRLSLGVAVYRTEKTNARTEDPTDSGDTVVLEGEQRADGLEVSAAGKITDKWQVFGGYALTLTKVTDSKNPDEIDNELTAVAANSFSLWTTYDLPWNLQIGGGAQYLDSRFSSTVGAARREAPSYVLFDAMAAWNVNKNFTLRLNVYNLADEEYIDRVGGGHFVPGAGRSAVLTASLRF
jgi:catecholate siderophore receptor